MINDNPVCEITCVHQDVVIRTKEKLITMSSANSLATLFKTLSDPTRIRMIDALFDNELCVCDLAEIIGLSQSATSHQLRVLRTHHLVKHRKEGKQVFYSLDDDHVSALYKQGLDHISEEPK
ncbi:MAG: hypothetical protein APF84_01675 [Gracilibacter sp. BRH_c7a]|nr:MAG: hypothetical protein APF84_01675 [Gracilibacter sp. BRH_c7a]